jgi:hypothetical protein
VKALSLRQPWAWLVVHAGKTIENRVWNTHYRGEFLIHAAKGMTPMEYSGVFLFLQRRGLSIDLPSYFDLPRGGVVGVAKVDGVLHPYTPADHARYTASVASLEANRADVDVRWHMQEQFGFVLANVRPTPFVPCAGFQRFFNLHDDVARLALGAA